MPVHRNFEFFWFPYTEYAIVKHGDETSDPIPRGRAWHDFQNIFLENVLLQFLSEISRLFPSLARYICRIEAAGSAGRQEDVNYSHRIFPNSTLGALSGNGVCVSGTIDKAGDRGNARAAP